MDNGSMLVEDETNCQAVNAMKEAARADGINKTYNYHKPSPSSLEKITSLRRAFSHLSDQIEQLSPKSREQAVALTNLEQSAMWAIKAVVCNDPESVVE